MLASGSGGNAVLVRSGDDGVLLDAGLTCRETLRRLHEAGVGVTPVDALFLSHGHNDHVSGALAVARRLKLPVYASRGTAREARSLAALPELSLFRCYEAVEVGELTVCPFPVPHDADEPVGFTVTDGRVRVGVATDLGSVTLAVLEALAQCDVVVIESNHDSQMLASGPYPAFLKRRIMGPHGHLSNDDACALIDSVYHAGLRHLVLAHLSRTNNTPELSRETALRALGTRVSSVEVHVGMQFQPCPAIRID